MANLTRTAARASHFRLVATLLAAKSAGHLSRLLRRGHGDALPGMVADLLFPQLGMLLAEQLAHGVLLVTGTNGKTTTTKLLADMLSDSGERVVSNRSGSNMKQGIMSSLVAAADIGGTLSDKPTIGLFEVDEGTLPLVVRSIGAEHILVTNLFRDQLDRYGDMDSLAAALRQALRGTNARLYLNADDPMVASLSRSATSNQVTYFGLETPTSSDGALTTAVDSVHCPHCGAKLHFGRRYYSHLGHYECAVGHFTRPHPDVTVSSIAHAQADGCAFTLTTPERDHLAEMTLGGLYNLYNALAALTLARGVGVPMSTALRSLMAARPAFGRVEQIDWDGHGLTLILVKNPAGATQVLDTFLRPEIAANVLIAVNDLDSDGRDVSWLWDVPFESLAGGGLNFVATGTRAGDVAVRLHYAGIEPNIIVGIEAALDVLHQRTEPADRTYLLATYTAMMAARRYLGRAGAMTGNGAGS